MGTKICMDAMYDKQNTAKQSFETEGKRQIKEVKTEDAWVFRIHISNISLWLTIEHYIT